MSGYFTERGKELNDKFFESMRALLDRPKPFGRVVECIPNNGNYFWETVYLPNFVKQ